MKQRLNLDYQRYDNGFESGSLVPPHKSPSQTRPKKKAKGSVSEFEEDMKQAIINLAKGAVGALDGTLIHASISFTEQHLYRARGTAHDARILNEALIDSEVDFPMPPFDKYYLCDAAYRHTRGFMAPYRNVRYWLGDFRRNRAMNSREKFNHAHAKLRNVIERAFGVLKAHFPILKKMPSYPFVTQRDIVVACFAIHNFIRKERLSDEFFSLYDHHEVYDSSIYRMIMCV
ncbi:putative nuclease HARBI1 [Tanacetum coccineum]